MTQIKENIIIKKEVEIVISVQAQKVLASTKYDIDKFIEWISSSKGKQVSIGGNDATLFLEEMYNKEVTK